MAKAKSEKTEECFAIMPISEVDGYPSDHFRHVFEDIIKPACALAGFVAKRADDVRAANLIHLEILKKLIETPVAVCDLSTRNPNVLFELGVRQAFDKPVVLIQEKGTIPIFDIGPLRYLEYSREMRYHEVLESQKFLADAITETMTAGSSNVNSIVKLLGLHSGASVPELGQQSKDSLAFEVLQAEMSDIRKMIQGLTQDQSAKRQVIGDPRAWSTNETLIKEFHALWQNIRHRKPDDPEFSSSREAMRDINLRLRKSELSPRQIDQINSLYPEIIMLGFHDVF